MKKGKWRFSNFILTVGLLATQLSISVSADENQKTSNRYNVVYVLDNSGSMKDTDPNNNRYNAVSHFNSLLANDGNYVGSVVFSDSIKEKHNVSEITSIAEKKDLISAIESTEIKGWTNIGEALLTAENMLKESGNPNQESIILFLTDGNTEMGTDDETKASLEKKAEAIQYARDNNIQIYSICLNMNGINSDTLNPQEMKQIADATGGGYAEVTSDDLTEVFQQFYAMIYGTEATQIGDDEIGEDGTYSKDFDIPAAGVEEANIIVKSEKSLTTVHLTQPDGVVLDKETLSDYMISAGDYSVIKITKPQGGTWNFYSEGTPNTSINISMMFNASLSVSAYIEDKKNFYEIDDTIRLVTELNTDGTVADGESVLDDYNIYATVTNQDGISKIIPVVFENGQYISDFSVSDYGTYAFHVTAEGNGITSQSEVSEVYVGNTPPVVLKDSLSAIGYIWPFVDLDCSVKLSDAVKDKEDEELKYTIDSTGFLEDSYTLDKDILSMKKFDISKGSFTVRATDSMGASVTFEVYMDSRNVPLYIAIGLSILVLLIFGIIFTKVYLDYLRYFKGTITVTCRTANGEQTVTRTPKRGRYRLSSFGFTSVPVGMNFRKMYFQAAGGGYVKLHSNKKIRSYGISKSVKKLNIASKTAVFTSQESGESILIDFTPNRR